MGLLKEGANLKLTPREREILQELARGKRTPEIGRDLFISESTVYRHYDNIKAKLGISGINRLIVYAIRKFS